MDPRLHTAVKLGNWDVIKEFEEELEIQRTPNKDTILHVLSRSCDSIFPVQQILQRKPELLLKVNEQKQNSLHVAARNGHFNVVHAMVDCIKRHKELRSFLRSRNVQGNLALHEAIKNNRREVIEVLVNEDPDQATIRNSAGKSSLYLAAERGDEVVVALILGAYKSSNSMIDRLFCSSDRFFIGPYRKTALHAAAIGNSPECLKLILRELPHLTKKVDGFGWTALHYAARFNHQEVTRQLLLADRSIGYLRVVHGLGRIFRVKFGNFDEDSKKTALHVAVTYGNIKILEELLTYCPDCWNMVFYKGRNAIHLAVENEQQELLDFILRMDWASELVNCRDNEGNTPLHLYIATKKLSGHELVRHSEVERNALNKDGLTPLDLLKDADQDKERQDFLRSELEEVGGTLGYPNIVSIKKDSMTPKVQSEETMNRMTETYQVVATLIITICFAAAFTIPGGYDSNDGSTKGEPVFLKRAAFRLFLLCNIFSMMCSLEALLSVLTLYDLRSKKKMAMGLESCRFFIVVSLIALVASFIAGLYVAVPDLGIRIILLFYGMCIVLLFFLEHFIHTFMIKKKGNFFF